MWEWLMIEFMFLRVRADVVTTAEGVHCLGQRKYTVLLVGQFGVALPFR
jgi:hypothetical protein